MKMELVTILGSMVVLFTLILVIKKSIKKWIHQEFCVLCATVSLTWISLLMLYWNGLFDNLLLIALLMGGTIVGLFYLIEQKVKKDLLLFRLPFFLTLIFLSYLLLNFSLDLWKSTILLLALWVLFTISYIYRNSPLFQKRVQQLIECCKRW